VRCVSGGLGGRHAQLGQQAAVVGLHPFLGRPPLVVVPENTDHFPLEVLPGGLDWTDRRVGKDPVKSPENVVRAAKKLPSTMICCRSLNAARRDAKYALSSSKPRSAPGPWKT
jgi:hypothetical protein